ncbi:MAG: septum formation protein Maf [Eubacterium sp.]|nr:septum formation protein Maf [Eubacterium sp.]
MQKIILASGSPRRRELLATAGIPFEVRTSDADETTTKTDPAEVVKELSGRKCLDVLRQMPPGAVVLGADTIVAMDGVILGKPESEADARRMLRELQGRTHDVYTGVTIAERCAHRISRKECFVVRTEVKIGPLSNEEIDTYIATGEPMDKAGAYGIQGVFSRHVEQITGDYFNVVGLPVHAVYEVLKNW